MSRSHPIDLAAWQSQVEEELRGRELQDPVAFGDVQEPVRREARAVRNVEGERRREVEDLVRDQRLALMPGVARLAAGLAAARLARRAGFGTSPRRV